MRLPALLTGLMLLAAASAGVGTQAILPPQEGPRARPHRTSRGVLALAFGVGIASVLLHLVGVPPLAFALIAAFPTGFTRNGVRAGQDVPKIGTTTNAGTAGGTTLRDTGQLTEADNYWRGSTVLILSGANLGQQRAVVGSTQATGTLTVDDAFTAQVAAGVKYVLIGNDASSWVKYFLGANTADNAADTSAVAANRDGSVLERLEQVQATLDSLEPIVFEPSTAPTIDEDGGRLGVRLGVVDRNSGPVAAGSITAPGAGANVLLEKSTAGGAFSSAGITQPGAPTVATGEVALDFDILAAEWQVGDAYRLTIKGVTATVGATTYYAGTQTWVGQIVEDLDVKTEVDDLYTSRVGPTTDPASETGGANARLGFLQTAVIKGTGTAIGANKSLVNALGNTGDAPVPAADNATAAGASSLQATVGRKDDTTLGLTAAATAVDSAFRYLKAIFDRTRLPSGADDATAAGSSSLGETLGRKDDTAPTAGTALGNWGALRILRGLWNGLGIAPASDNTTASATSGLYETLGAKGDTALSATSTYDSTHGAMFFLHSLVSRTTTPAADNTTAAASSGLADTTGRKDDASFAVGTASAATDTLMRRLRSLYDRSNPPAAADNATAAATSTLYETLGRKDDAAATTTTATRPLSAYLKAIFSALGVWTSPARATVVCPTAAETDLVAQVTITTPTHVLAHLDLTNLTVNATVQIYEAGGASGSTLTKTDPVKSWAVATDQKILLIEFWALSDYKITLTTGAEGANRNVYVRHSRRATGQ